MRYACVVVVMAVAAGAIAFGAPEAPKAETKVINDFENNADKDMFADSSAAIAISAEHATSGKQSLKVDWIGNKPLSAIATMSADWSGFKSFKFDLFMEGDASFTLRLKDKAGKDYGVWQENVNKGANTVIVDLDVAGKTLDLTQINHFFMYLVDENGKATGYVDNLRLEK